MKSRNRLSDLMALVFEKPKSITEKIRVCEKMQNAVEKAEGDSNSP